MKSFLKNVVQRREGLGGALIGRTVKVGPFTVRVEAHIADGGFACIYKVRDVETGRQYAMKHMRLMGESEAIADCMTEVNTLKKLRDVPTILTLRAAAFSGARGNEQEAYLILDLCKDNLVEYVQAQGNKLSSSTVIQIFSSVAQAVSALHQQSPPWAHRDLKAENVLQNQDGDWVLCDFGSVTDKVVLYESSNAVMMGEEIIRKYTTPSYRAPEMWDLYSRERIDTKADIWALGCLLYYLMFGKLAFQAEAKLAILNGDVLIPPTRPPPLVALLKELLVVSPLQRPDILTVLRRLQEVADAMNVDPALLVPRQSPPHATGGSASKAERVSSSSAPAQPDFSSPHKKAPAPRVPSNSAGTHQEHQEPAPMRQSLQNQAPLPPQGQAAQQQASRLQPQRSSLQHPGSAGHSQAASLQHETSHTAPLTHNRLSSADTAALRSTTSIPPPPTGVSLAPAPQLSSSSMSRMPSGQGSFSEQASFASFAGASEPAGFANFANFDDAASPAAATPRQEEPQRLSASPPKMQRRSTSRQSSLKSIDAVQTQSSVELASLRKLVADLQAQVQQLQATMKGQQVTIKQLQVDNFNHVSQLKKLGLDPAPSVLAPPKAVAQTVQNQGSGWASFGSLPMTDSLTQEGVLPPLRTGSAASEGLTELRSSPSKARVSGVQTARSPAVQANSNAFDAFAKAGDDATPNSVSGQDSVHDSPSDTLSRHSALSAFAESLKQPALMDNDKDSSSPLSDSKSELKPQKPSRKSHRRSTSEPTAIEKWNLVVEN